MERIYLHAKDATSVVHLKALGIQTRLHLYAFCGNLEMRKSMECAQHAKMYYLLGHLVSERNLNLDSISFCFLVVFVMIRYKFA